MYEPFIPTTEAERQMARQLIQAHITLSTLGSEGHALLSLEEVAPGWWGVQVVAGHPDDELDLLAENPYEFEARVALAADFADGMYPLFEPAGLLNPNGTQKREHGLFLTARDVAEARGADTSRVFPPERLLSAATMAERTGKAPRTVRHLAEAHNRGQRLSDGTRVFRPEDVAFFANVRMGRPRKERSNG